MAASPKPKSCGDFGGVTAKGAPCTRPAGWGVDASGGLCKHHAPPTDAAGRVVGAIEGDEPPAPPGHLSETAAARWRALTSAWIFGPSELLLLEEMLSAWDRVRECRATLRREGFVLVNPDSGNQKRHPAARELDQSLTQMRQCIKALDLEAPE